MFQKWNQSSRDRYELLRRDVHVVNFRRFYLEEVAAITNRNFFAGKMSAAVDRRIRLRNQIIFFFVARQVIDLIRDPAIRDLAVRRFNETKFIDPREGRHRANQTDVRSFRCLDRTNAAVVRWVHVAHFESGAIAAQSTGSERGQAALVRELCQRIRLIHELRELRATEEISNHGAERFWIHQLLRRHAVDVDVEQSHALFHQTLGPGETDAALIGEQLADRSDAAAAKMIDVIQRAFAAAQVDQIFDRSDKIFVSQNSLGQIDIDAQLQVLDVIEKLDNFLVRAVAECAQESGGQEFATAFAPIEINIEQIRGVELHLDPRTPVGNNAEAVEHFAVEVDGRFKRNTGRTVQL